MRFSIHQPRNTDGENQHPGNNIAKHKRTACQYDTQQGNCDIGDGPAVLGGRVGEEVEVFVGVHWVLFWIPNMIGIKRS